MLRYLKLLWLFVRVSVQAEASYRVDFFVNGVRVLAQLGGELMGLWTIFSNTRSLLDWTVYEVVALLGVFRIMAGIIGLAIAPNMRAIMEEIRDGKLDYAILKPVNSQFFVSARKVVIWQLADIASGVLLAAIAAIKLSANVSAGTVAHFLVLLAAGTVIIYSVWLVLATLAFWFTRISNIEMVFWNVFEAGRYPVDIYQPWLRLGLTYVLPLAFLTTFPARALIGRGEAGGLAIAIIAAAAALAGASAFWRFGLRRYSGASA